MQLSVKDAANLLRISEDAVYRWVKAGVLPAYHINEQYRFNRSELLEWATARQMDIGAEVFGPEACGPEASGSEAYRGEPRKRTAPSSLAEALAAGDILYGVEGGDKTSVLRGIINLLTLPEEVDREFLFQVLLARETLGSTGIGGGIAIPHVRNPVILHITRPAVTICFLKQPIDFQAIDGQPVHTLFLLITPTIRAHLHLLSRLGFVLRDKAVKEALRRQPPRQELLEILTRAESGLVPPVVPPVVSSGGPPVVPPVVPPGGPSGGVADGGTNGVDGAKE